VGLDADGETRCDFAPTVGADESNFPTPSPDAIIAAPDTVYENSPAIFYSAFKPLPGVILDYTWYLDGIQIDKIKNHEKIQAAGTYDLSLRVKSCNGKDSTGITLDVIAPTSTPVSDFTASKLV